MSDFEDKLQSILGNPDAMDQIMSIARSITGNSAPPDDTPCADVESTVSQTMSSFPQTEDPFSALGNLDPRLVQIGMRLLSEYNSSDDQKTALLKALQPFLRPERYAKVDKAVRIAKLSHLIRVALDSFRKGDVDLV